MTEMITMRHDISSRCDNKSITTSDIYCLECWCSTAEKLVKMI